MILPIMIYHFNIVGIYFLITNLLVNIIIGPIMFLSILFVIISFLKLKILQFISIFLTIGLELLTQISNIANLPLAKIYVCTPKILVICIYYIFILLVTKLCLIYLKKENTCSEKRIKNLIALFRYNYFIKKDKILKKYKNVIVERNIKVLFLKFTKIFVLILLLLGIVNSNKRLEIHFLDVGQGDCCFIITPNKKSILIDGGGSTSDNYDVGENTLIPYLLDKGYKKIDYIFITHFDQDHVGGILSVLEELQVGKIYISKQEEISENYDKFLDIVKSKELKVKLVQAGDNLNIDNIKIQILWPVKESIKENILNNNAIVMKLEYANFSMLFTGDIEEIAEKELIKLYGKTDKLQANILKVAHHGSKTSSSQEFIELVKPQIALIGVGKNNLFGHPSQIVLERLENYGTKIYRTDEDGEISIYAKTKRGIIIKGFKHRVK